MFRNFYGQWGFAFVFFYAILIGQSLVIIFSKIKKQYEHLLAFFIFGLLIANAWPFINGSLIRLPLYQLKDINPVIHLDPQYKNVLEFIHSYPLDGKVLSLPLVGPGYQVLAGQDSGLYIGPSTFSYLAGKNDFTGYEGLGPYGELFLKAVHNQDYSSLQKLFRILNIRFIFYNSDPKIYDNILSASIYDYVKDFLPQNQQSYQEFIEQLAIKKKIDFGDKYHFYELNQDYYLPQIYTVERTTYVDNSREGLFLSFLFNLGNDRDAIYDQNSVKPELRARYIGSFDDILLSVEKKSDFFEFLKKRKGPEFGEAWVSRKLTSVIYPLVLWREEKQLAANLPRKFDQYFDRAVFFSKKRIRELEVWGKEVPLLGGITSIETLAKTWKEPKIWEIGQYQTYNSWEISFVRYEKSIIDLVDKIKENKTSSYSLITNLVNLRSILSDHKATLAKTIQEDSLKSDSAQKYLLQLSDKMFVYLQDYLDIPIPDPTTINYSLEVPQEATYEVYVEKNKLQGFNQQDLSLNLGGKKLLSDNHQSQENWIRFNDLHLEVKPSLSLALKIQNSPNLIDSSSWQSPEKKETVGNSASLTVNTLLDTADGIIARIAWEPEVIYLISFDYKTYDKKFKMNAYSLVGQETPAARRILEDELRANDWKTYKAVVNSGSDTKAGLLQITKIRDRISEDLATAKIDIRNLSVIPIPHPDILLRKTISLTKPRTVLPKITFTKINPTKYQVQVRGAQDPYTLVFLEAFNPKWKLYLLDSPNRTKTLKAILGRFIGSFAKTVVSLFLKEQTSANKTATIASYFNGEVNEGKHREIFFESRTMETWGQDPIAENQHLLVNGYANGWDISPSHTEGKSDYTLVLEMSTQKQFYPFLFVSLSTVFFLFIYFWIVLFKNK